MLRHEVRQARCLISWHEVRSLGDPGNFREIEDFAYGKNVDGEELLTEGHSEESLAAGLIFNVHGNPPAGEWRRLRCVDTT